jgi:glycosyltransferase involved in cell wall biosynthesis
MNVLFLTGSLGLGGAEKQLLVWVEMLQADLGMKVSVACFDETRLERLQALEEMGVPVTVAGRDQGTAKRLERVVSFARKNRADIVHAFNYYLATSAIIAAAVVRGTPAASFQGDGVSDMEGLDVFRRQPPFKLVKYFTSNSHEAMARVRPQLRSKALLQYVPNLVAAPAGETFETRFTDGRRGTVALVVARLDDNKRVNVFLDALAAARQAEPDINGVVVGDGPSRQNLEEQAARLGLLPGGVEFLGKLPDVWARYAAADVFVHLALSEGTPNVVLEAMTAGLPVVATAAGDVGRIVQPDHNGLLVPFDDAPAVTRCLVELARSPQLRARLGRQGRLDVQASFGAKQVRDSLERFYSAVQRSEAAER